MGNKVLIRVSLPTQSSRKNIHQKEKHMNDFDWADRNEYRVGFYDSKVVNTDSHIPVFTCFTRKELLRLRDAVNETLKAYDELGWDDSDVRKRNEFLEQEFWRKAKEEREKPSQKKKNSQDYLYLIHDTIQNTLKIGISANPKNRFRNIQLATSNKLVMLYALKGKAHLEKDLHKEFAEIRLASEWFKYDERIIERYKSL